MGPISTGLGEIYQYELVSKTEATTKAPERCRIGNVRRQLSAFRAQPRSTVSAVLKNNIRSGSPGKLQSFTGWLYATFTKPFRANNANVGGLILKKARSNTYCAALALVEKAEDVSEHRRQNRRGRSSVCVRDVGEVVEGFDRPASAVTADGKGEIVAGIVLMLKAQIAHVVNSVKERVEQVKNLCRRGWTRAVLRPHGIDWPGDCDRWKKSGRGRDSRHHRADAAVEIGAARCLSPRSFRFRCSLPRF